jgi:hypothetical protein
MAFYDEVAADADALIAELGTTSTLTRTVPGGYDPDTGTTTGDVTTVYPCTLAVIPIADKFVDGTRILTGDQEAYMSAVGLGDPMPGDVVVWRGATYTTVKGEILAPAGTAVLYTLQLRK